MIRKGVFTLVEILAVVLILGILAAVVCHLGKPA
jgi:prepilin-type N-terminal cleavage/methylation domain-containing protein